ncbi:MAG: ABC transporter substrate-binding protein [Chloroflexi bacterium]|nr:ABC transporter substrate-binding protein [Chloroflexota bacterium]
MMAEGKFGGSLRIVSQASVATLDPYWTQAYVTAAVASHIYEQPFGWDADLVEKPQMVDTWSASSDNLTYTFTLRSGLTFHDGATVTAEDVTTSFTRWLGGQDAAAGLMREFVGTEPFTVVDSKTFRVNLAEPFGAILDGMARPWSGVFVMPARIANVPSSTSVEQHIGSSPYKFKSWNPGDKLTLERYDGYVADPDAESGYVGKHVAYIDELTWLEIPDEETKIAGLETGEWDVVDGAGLDFFSRLSSNSDLEVALYQAGHRSALGLIPTHAPFDDLTLRRAVQISFDYRDFMQVLGPSDLWELCPAFFYCGTQWETDAGASEYYNVNDPAAAREMVAESNYAGETVILLNPTDYATLTPTGPVAKQAMEQIGINVEMPALDWATVVTQLGDPDAFHAWTSWGVHWCCGDPIRSSIFGGDQAFWPKVPKIQRLRIQFAQEVDYAARFALIEEMQIEAYKSVLWIEPGTFFSIYPHTAKLKNFHVRALPFYTSSWLE